MDRAFTEGTEAGAVHGPPACMRVIRWDQVSLGIFRDVPAPPSLEKIRGHYRLTWLTSATGRDAFLRRTVWWPASACLHARNALDTARRHGLGSRNASQVEANR